MTVVKLEDELDKLDELKEELGKLEELNDELDGMII